MEAAENISQENLDKMDSTDLEASREKSEAVAEHQEVSEEDTAVDIIGVLEDR
jgi:hypothetical protein